MRKVKVTVPASTTNIGCGFDCLGLALSLYNTIEIELTEEEGVFIEIEGEGKELIPDDSSNIIFPAIKLVFERMKKKLQGIKIKEVNCIPLEKGLGSSGATRVGGIVAANYLLHANLSPKEILKMVTLLEGHPDNAAASLIGGLVAVTESQGEPVWVKLSIPCNLKVVVVLPEIRIPTSKARKILPEKISFSDAVFNLSRLAVLVSSLSYGIWENLPLATQDRLHQPYRSSLLPGMNKIFEAALDTGAKGVFLSSAGSGIAAFSFEKEARKVGEAMQKVFFEEGIKAEVLVLSVDQEGCRVKEEEQ